MPASLKRLPAGGGYAFGSSQRRPKEPDQVMLSSATAKIARYVGTAMIDGYSHAAFKVPGKARYYFVLPQYVETAAGSVRRVKVAKIPRKNPAKGRDPSFAAMPHTYAGDYTAGVTMNKWHDQGHTVHALRADNSPACGVSYYTASGLPGAVLADVTCRKCAQIVAKRARGGKRAPKSNPRRTTTAHRTSSYVTDAKVIDAFLACRPAESKRLSTDGVSLDIDAMGGKGIAVWKGGMLVVDDNGSKSGETLRKAVLRKAPLAFLAPESYWALTAAQERSLRDRGLHAKIGRAGMPGAQWKTNPKAKAKAAKRNPRSPAAKRNPAGLSADDMKNVRAFLAGKSTEDHVDTWKPDQVFSDGVHLIVSTGKSHSIVASNISGKIHIPYVHGRGGAKGEAIHNYIIRNVKGATWPGMRTKGANRAAMLRSMGPAKRK